MPYKMKFGEIGFLKIFYLVEIDVDKLVEVGVETLDDVEADDEVDALQIKMIYYLVNISAGARPGDKRLGGAGGGGALQKTIFGPSGFSLVFIFLLRLLFASVCA